MAVVEKDHRISFNYMRDIAAAAGDPARRRNVAFSPTSLRAALTALASTAPELVAAQLLSLDFPHYPDTAATTAAGYAMANGSNLGGPYVHFNSLISSEKSLVTNNECLEKEMEPISSLCPVFLLPTDFQEFPGKADKVRERANNWTIDSLNELLGEQILPPGSVADSTQLVVCNAMGFCGSWDDKLCLSKSKNGEFKFHRLDNSLVSVPCMTSSGPKCIKCFKEFKVLRLPFKKGSDFRQFSLCIFLPNALDGIWQLEDRFRLDQQGSWILDRHIPSKEVAVGELKVPVAVSGFCVIAALGLVWPFVNDEDSGMPFTLYAWSEIFLEDDEKKLKEETTNKGKISEKSDCGSCNRAGKQSDAKDFVADHPFIYLIREDETGSVLFTGHVLDPSA